MPIVFAPLVGLALGVVLAWVAAPELVRIDGPVVASRPFAVVAAFAGLLWVPAVGYFVVFHGDWSYLYVVPWQSVPSAVDLCLVLLAGASVVGGFWVAVPSLRKRRQGPLAALVVAPIALVLLGVALAGRRLAVSGTFAQYHGDFGTEPVAASTLGRGVLLFDVALALGVAWAVRALLAMAAEARAA
jgi:hypothetical protein